MKKQICAILCFASMCGLLGAFIWAVVFQFSHIDMTSLRCFVENPGPTIMAAVSLITIGITTKIIDKDNRK